MVDLRQGVGPGTVAGLAREGRIGLRRHMRQGEGDVGEERLAGVRVALDEGGGALGQFLVQGALAGQVQLLHLARRLVTPGFVDVLRRHQALVPALLAAHRRGQVGGLVGGGPHDFVVGTGYAVPLVEALLGGEARLAAAQVPLAPDAGGVAARREQFGQGRFPQGQAVRCAGAGDPVGAGADREAAGHQRRARGRALCLDIEVGQADTLLGQLVDPRRLGAPDRTAAVAAQLAVAEVVVEHDDDVRLCCLGQRCQQTPQQRQSQQVGFHGTSSDAAGWLKGLVAA
ncbi:hypothetical protein D3C84_499770 [compost metagenome]